MHRPSRASPRRRSPKGEEPTSVPRLVKFGGLERADMRSRGAVPVVTLEVSPRRQSSSPAFDSACECGGWEAQLWAAEYVVAVGRWQRGMDHSATAEAVRQQDTDRDKESREHTEESRECHGNGDQHTCWHQSWARQDGRRHKKESRQGKCFSQLCGCRWASVPGRRFSQLAALSKFGSETRRELVGGRAASDRRASRSIKLL